MSRLDNALDRRQRRDEAETNRPARRPETDSNHLLRALSHDISANFMLLESSFGRLRNLLDAGSLEDTREVVAHVDACIDESKRLLGDLSRLARTGDIEMDSARVSLDEVVDEVLFEQRETIRDRGIRVDVVRPLPDAWCNRQRAKQVVTNLVRNAIKHGCDRTQPILQIVAKLAETPQFDREGRPLLVLRVQDNGPGIDLEHRERIFLPGVRLMESVSDGSGMGLAIVRKIAEHYGGRAWVDADNPRGAAIMVSLPSATGRPQSPDARRMTIERDGPHRTIPPLRGHAHPRPTGRHGRG